MKKAGIVTFWGHDNFGAMFQAYALMKTVASFGLEPVFISFDDEKKKVAVKPNEQAANAIFLKKLVQESAQRSSYFSKFREKYLPSVAYHDSIGDEMDAFIAGSDQIWNKEITGDDDRYFLTFCPDSKKISYAASFGRSSLSDTEKETAAEKLRGFLPYISVREESGVHIVKEITGEKAKVCLDPVLLTSSGDWNDMLPVPEEKPYLLLVMVQNDIELYRSARKLAEEKGLQFKIVTASLFPAVGFDPWSRVSVPDWAGLIAGASYVVSSSFHGIAFSLIFHKSFTFSPLKAELANRNTRVRELLTLFGLEDREKRTDEIMNWERIDEIRNREINDSRNYIADSLRGRNVL